MANAAPACLKDFEAVAHGKMSKNTWDFFGSGANDEETLRDNEQAFQRYRLRPRVLQDVSRVDTATTLLGAPVHSPIGLAPSAMHELAHERGELATAAAAAKLGMAMTLSTYATQSIEDVKAVAGPAAINWFQLYVFQNRTTSAGLIRRAEAAGYKAIVLTVDAPVIGRRLSSIRNQFKTRPPLRLANFDPSLGVRTGVELASNKELSAAQSSNKTDISLNWEHDLAWLRTVTTLPLILKGILTAADAELACHYGVDAIWVSNHGGRQLDGAPATLDVLAEIVQTVRGRAEVYMDGGVRHGSDVYKAIALGARAVFVGRPVLWGLAYDGEQGLHALLEIIQQELVATMALSGCTKLSDITPDRVQHLAALALQSRL